MSNGLYVEISGTRISISFEAPPASPEVILSDEEQAALEFVFSALKEGGVDTSRLMLERTKEYLKIIAYVPLPEFVHRPAFCRLKLFGRLFYMELTLHVKAIKGFKDEPRFDGVNFGNKRFTRIPIQCASEIPRYSDIIRMAYEWGTEVQI